MKHNYLASGVAAAAILFSLPAASQAEDAAITKDAGTTRKLKQIFENHSLRFGLESAGPLRFNDTPDMSLDKTTVFQYGARLGFLFGSEQKDTHRLGVGLAYNFVAKSESRNLKFVDPYFIYETGKSLILQIHAGASIATGTTDLANDHGGVYNAVALRYSFQDADDTSPLRVSPGIIGKSYLVTGDMSKSSFFLGAQLEVTYNTNR